MDPALRELLREEPPDRVVEAIIRLRQPRVRLPGVRIVARFRHIATCRLPVSAIRDVWADPNVVSLKAARPVGLEVPVTDPADLAGWDVHPQQRTAAMHPASCGSADDMNEFCLPRRPPGLPETGAGVVVGAVDMGLDVDHPNFKHRSGSTRLIALWDQRPRSHQPHESSGGALPPATAPQPYGYGTLYSRARINQALRTPTPYLSLGYHHAGAHQAAPAHGTHVMDIAAGNGTVGPSGVAPAALLVFVHLANRGTGGLATMGDSVKVLEGIKFISRAAGSRPWVINLSLGMMGGPHDGTLLNELAFDELLSAAPGCVITQSAGNYHQARTHSSGVLRDGERTTLRFVVDPADITPNELEIWYAGADEFAVRIDPPGTDAGEPVVLGGTAELVVDGRVVGRIYHRDCEPNNCDNQIDAFLYPWAPPGIWQVTLEARRIQDGRFHAWLERDSSCPGCQARFVPDDTDPQTTTGTIANGHLPLVVGAYDAHSPARELNPSSSAGPTRDGRCKPDLVAPGHGVLAACSAPPGSDRSPGLLTVMTGTSMASPHVAGAVALCLERTGNRLGAAEIRKLVLSSADPPVPGTDQVNRLGQGYLNIPALLDAVRQSRPHEPGVSAVERDDILPLALAPDRVYRELLYRPTEDLSGWLRQRFSILGRPGERVTETPDAGDVLVRVTLGQHGSGGACTVVAEPGLTRRRTSAPGAPAGWYAVTAAPGSDAGQAVLVLDHTGVVPAGWLLLRPLRPDPDGQPASGNPPGTAPPWDAEELQDGDTNPDCGCGRGGGEGALRLLTQDMPGEDAGPSEPGPSEPGALAAGPSDPGPWKGTPAQLDFRSRVLAEHIARKRQAKDPQRDLRPDELADVPGTCVVRKGRQSCVQTLPHTAQAAGRLLDAANADLGAAQRAGDADALRTVRLRATSGYRGSDHQKELWLDYFATKYYDQTRAARAKIPDGPHSAAAVDYMLRPKQAGGYGIGGRIAAPGYSNHQGGIAIDFWQDRTGGNGIANDSDDSSRCRWRQSWFHGWLRTHAPACGFQPIPTEEWHWEYRPGVTAAPDVREYRGGKLWTFDSAAHPAPVAVFCPKAALGRPAVDVVIYAHGLLSGCHRPKGLPAGFVTGAPFDLGRVADESGRPVILVVPLLDWANPCGAVVFGRGHERWHPLGRPSGLNTLLTEVLTETGRVQGISAPALRNLMVAGHSRAYDMLEPLAASRADPEMQRGALARLREIWAFDTTYAGDVAAWTDWLAQNPSLRLHVFYRPGTKTGAVGDRFLAQAGGRLAVTTVHEEHCDVPAKRLAEMLRSPDTAKTEAADVEASWEADVSGTPRADLDPDLSATLGLASAPGEAGEDAERESFEDAERESFEDATSEGTLYGGFDG
jgi:Subtilase family/D-alanyl-D-alanine carboxypeptidase